MSESHIHCQKESVFQMMLIPETFQILLSMSCSLLLVNSAALVFASFEQYAPQKLSMGARKVIMVEEKMLPHRKYISQLLLCNRLPRKLCDFK